MAPQLRICCRQRIPFSLTRQFSEEEGSLYPVQFSFLYKTFHERLNRALYIESLLPPCYRQHKFRLCLKRYGHHSGCSPGDKCLLRSLENSDCGFITQTGTDISPYFIFSMYSCVIAVLAKPRYSSNNFNQISTIFKNSGFITKPRKDRWRTPQKTADKICMHS